LLQVGDIEQVIVDLHHIPERGADSASANFRFSKA
jgi:hypothetical protein